MCTERQRESTPKKERERARPSERASKQEGSEGEHKLEPAAATGSRRRPQEVGGVVGAAVAWWELLWVRVLVRGGVAWWDECVV